MARIARAWATSILCTRGRPRCFPSARARLTPAITRSRINLFRVQQTNGELWQLIEGRWQARAVGTRIVPWVFHRRGKPIRDVLYSWRKACAAARVVGRIPHDFRRTRVRDLLNAGVPEKVAMEWTATRRARSSAAIISSRRGPAARLGARGGESGRGGQHRKHHATGTEDSEAFWKWAIARVFWPRSSVCSIIR